MKRNLKFPGPCLTERLQLKKTDIRICFPLWRAYIAFDDDSFNCLRTRSQQEFTSEKTTGALIDRGWRLHRCEVWILADQTWKSLFSAFSEQRKAGAIAGKLLLACKKKSDLSASNVADRRFVQSTFFFFEWAFSFPDKREINPMDQGNIPSGVSGSSLTDSHVGFEAQPTQNMAKSKL